MARARSIKPGFFQNEFMASKRPEVQLLFLGLLTIADREGRLEDRPVKIKGQVFPYTDIDVDSALSELAAIEDPFQDQPFIYRYVINGRRYIQIANWSKHQNVHPKEFESKIPPMDTAMHESSMGHACQEKRGSGVEHEASMNHAWPEKRGSNAMHESCMGHASAMHGEKTTGAEGIEGIEGIEGEENTNPPLKESSKGKQTKPRFVPPTVQEVSAYVKSNRFFVDAETFVSFYESKGWLVGKVPMRDWRAAVRTWHKKSETESPAQREGPRERTLEEITEDRKRRERARQEQQRRAELERRGVSS